MRNWILVLIPIIFISAGVSSGESRYKFKVKPSALHKKNATKLYGEDEIRALIAGNGDFSSYSRLSGLINDILREQRTLFMKHRVDGANTISLDAEELMNQAALQASEDNYIESFNGLSKAFDILAVSISDLQSK